jgi:hypothetical protein
VLAFLAAVLAASTTTPSTPPAKSATPAQGTQQLEVLESTMPWWERITVAFDDKGAQQSCRYQSSLSLAAAAACDDEMASNFKSRPGGDPQAGVYSKLTFERRFSPVTPDSGRLQPGDQLLGRQVMYLTINAQGSIDSCKVVSSSGDMTPQYDCDAVKSETFRQASASSAHPRQAFMTVLAYGHMEQIV